MRRATHPMTCLPCHSARQPVEMVSPPTGATLILGLSVGRTQLVEGYCNRQHLDASWTTQKAIALVNRNSAVRRYAPNGRGIMLAALPSHAARCSCWRICGPRGYVLVLGPPARGCVLHGHLFRRSETGHETTRELEIGCAQSCGIADEAVGCRDVTVAIGPLLAIACSCCSARGHASPRPRGFRYRYPVTPAQAASQPSPPTAYGI
jgi:hypothetical protein